LQINIISHIQLKGLLLGTSSAEEADSEVGVSHAVVVVGVALGAGGGSPPEWFV